MPTVDADVLITYRLLVVWEAAAVLRHDLRNKLASVRNASFYLQRRVEREAAELVARDQRIPTFFELIGKELDAADAIISDRLPKLEDQPVSDAIALDMIVDRAVGARSLPAGVELVRHPGGPAARVCAGEELAAACFCLVENACDAVVAAGGGVVSVTCRVDDDRALIEVVDDGGGMSEEVARRARDHFFTTRPGRVGLGLPIAHRIANRAGGTLELVPCEVAGRPGVRATIVVPGAAR